MTYGFKTPILAAALSVVALFPADAAIIGATSAAINTSGPGFGSINDTFNQNGLSANYISGVTDFDSFVATTSHTAIFPGFEWFGNLGTNSAAVTYDLGAVTSVNKMALWNEETSGIGVLDLLVSSDGITFTSLLSGLLPTDNPLTPDGFGGFVPYMADVFTFATTSFRYITLNMGGCPQPITGNVFESCAIGEVAFNQVAAVPVPAAGFLLVGALGGLAALRRRRRAA